MKENERQVLVDLSAFRPDRTGGAQRFVYELFGRLSRAPSLRLNFVVNPCASEWMSAVPGVHHDDVSVIDAPGSGFVKFALLKSAVRHLSFELSADIVLSPLNLPVLRTHGREIMTVHDLAPIFYLREPNCRPPSVKGRMEMRGRIRRVRAAIGEGKDIVTDSAAINVDLLGLGASGCRTVHLGGDSEAVVSATSRWKVDNLDRRLVVVVSSTRPHKNLDMLRTVASSGSAALSNVTYVLVGLEGAHRSLEFPSNVKALGSVSEADLVELLATASCLFSPSMYEGFGLPVAEAMHLKVPVVISRIAPHRELAGDGGKYFHPLDGDEAITALGSVLTDHDGTVARSGRLSDRAERFRWGRCSDQYASLMRA